AENRRSAAAIHGSAAECLLILSGLLAASYLLAQVLPGVRAENHPSLYRGNPNLIMIQDAFASSDSLATISSDRFKTWKARPQRDFDGLAFYRIAKENIAPPVGRPERWKVAHASMNLFWMLGLPTELSAVSGDAVGRTQGVILSDRIWRKDFAADPK